MDPNSRVSSSDTLSLLPWCILAPCVPQAELSDLSPVRVLWCCLLVLLAVDRSQHGQPLWSVSRQPQDTCSDTSIRHMSCRSLFVWFNHAGQPTFHMHQWTLASNDPITGSLLLHPHLIDDDHCRPEHKTGLHTNTHTILYLNTSCVWWAGELSFCFWRWLFKVVISNFLTIFDRRFQMSSSNVR